jgi:hypothetical protein
MERKIINLSSPGAQVEGTFSNPGVPPLAPGADGPLTVTGGEGSTSDVDVDSKGQVLGWIPETSICIKNPA